MNESIYPPIEDYGLIADCHSSALVSKSGSIDWCCMPRFDSGSCFGRILDWNKGGYCQIVPVEAHRISRRYLEGTLILETTFTTGGGEARLIDCFTMRQGGEHNPHQQILRILEGISGRVDFLLEVVPRFDYGAVKPWIRRWYPKHFIAIGASDGLLISGDFPMEMKHRHDLVGSVGVVKGQRVHLSLVYRRPEILDEGRMEPAGIDVWDRRLKETVDWWRSWSNKLDILGAYAAPIRTSALVLKGLINAPTGAITAAPTTSLPEAPGGSRNWDYRFSWIRDSSFTVRSLGQLGYTSEADGFRRYIERTAAGSADELQVMFGLGGERRLIEFEIPELEGYRGAKPVRVGNAARRQVQLDVYGGLLDLSWRWHEWGHSPDDDYWDFLVQLVNTARKCWRQPDQGIWELRGKGRHFVHSKVMCWAALDRGIKLAEDLGRDGPVADWKSARDEVRRAVEEKGYDLRRGVFIQAFDHPVMDSSLLLLPTVDFVHYEDERMIRTTDAVHEELEENGFLRRYRVGDDGIECKEGTFIACTFWLAECYARQNRRNEAREVFQRALATANDLALYSEEYDTENGRMLGNFPQALTHLSLISAAVALRDMEEKTNSGRN